MEKQLINESIVAIFKSIYNSEPNFKTNLKDIGDEFDQIELIMKIEEKYEIQISDHVSNDFNNLDDIIAYLENI